MESERYVGQWWIPGEQRRIGGVLVIEDGGRSELELTENISSYDDEVEIIHGASAGKVFTLLNCIVVSYSTQFASEVVTETEKLRPRVALAGILLAGADNRVFCGIEAEISNLAQWAHIARIDREMNWNRSPRIKIAADEAEPLTIALPERCETLTITSALQGGVLEYSGARLSASIHQSTTLVIRSSEPRAWLGYQETLRQFCNLIALATQKASTVVRMSLLSYEDENSDAASIKHVAVYRRQLATTSSVGQVKRHNLLFRLTDMADGEIIGRWLELHNRPTMQLPLATLFGLDSVKDDYYESRLFSIASAAEGIHVALSGNIPTIDKERLGAIRAAVREVLNDEDWRWATQKLADHGPGLKGRLMDLATRADSVAVNALVGDVDLWAKWLTRARNSIGHPSGKKPSASAPEVAFFKLAYVTRALLHLVLMAEIGISPELQRRAVENSWDYVAHVFCDEAAKERQRLSH